MIEIKDGVVILEDEFVFKASRSRGPGGLKLKTVLLFWRMNLSLRPHAVEARAARM
jgi:hypothetical protein